MGCCSSLLSGPNVDPAEKALEYELSDLKIEELMEFMAAVDLGWPEVRHCTCHVTCTPTLETSSLDHSPMFAHAAL